MSTISPIDTGNNYRDPFDMFADREEILAMFQQALQSTQRGRLHLLVVKGNSGTGKTFLISYLVNRICPQLEWPTGLLTFVQSTPDFRTILEGLEDALKNCVPLNSLRLYRDKQEEYKRRFDEYRSSITINQTVEAREYASLSEINQSVQVNAELRRRELHLRTELSRALVELAEECEHPLCLFIDGYERLAENDPELVGWLWEEVMFKLVQSDPQPLLVVTCGWEWPSSPAIQPFTQASELDDFDLAQMRSYLHKQGILLIDPPISTQDELVTVFYDLTKGHPLVLSLAATYFNELDAHERTPAGLRADRPLIDEKARVAFLQERLLSRLKEPFRTLLEHGPVLRFFDQAALQSLLREGDESVTDELHEVSDHTYDRFLAYPFIRQLKIQRGDQKELQFAFHELVRWIGLSALRRHHPQTKEQLHRKMADYYRKIVEAERKREAAKSGMSTYSTMKDTSTDDYGKWFAEIPEREFWASLEYLYHALQVETLQVEAFKDWKTLAVLMITRWRRRQAGLVLEIVPQLADEGEPFLSKSSNSFGQYLIWHSKFLQQEARWEEARIALEQATKIFESIGNLPDLAGCLDNIGVTYHAQGELEQALSYHESALALFEQLGDLENTGTSLHNIGYIFYSLGQMEQALSYYKRAFPLYEQIGDPAHIATLLNNIGLLYYSQNRFEQALSYYKNALLLREQLEDPARIADSLNNIGVLHQHWGNFEEALRYQERALALREQVGDPAETANSFHNIGHFNEIQGRLEQALSYYKRALLLKEQVGNPAEIAVSLNNIGGIYASQEKWEEALLYYKRSLTLYEQIGNLANVARSLNNIGYVYRHQEKLEEALNAYQRALAIREEVGNPDDLAVSLNNISFIYASQGRWEEALDCHERALAIRKESGNPSDIAHSLFTDLALRN